ncbi:glycosyltransferase family 4 protein [Vibrio sp. ZSDZ34]|uniref:Glycosyltransferase family 4 protein n=1 Tax=Vibrio gelatinilyticus TaxID=2893468 RepID=A0A9X2AUH0_9VIBR|nr:glycosyltransferase family 4 protein [Vibrio gelatinilyticus]MCJ2375340.1 glycosyltransferase family 4 protein [Vibrio gelatinilyticus]
MSSVKPNDLLLIVDSSNFGGIEAHVLQLSLAMRLQSVHVTAVLLDSYSDNPLIQKLKEHQVDYLCLKQMFPKIPFWKRLHQLMMERCPKAIHSHGYKANLLCRWTQLRWPNNSIAYVASFHAGETPKGRVRLYDMLDRYTAFLSDNNICVSKRIQEKLPCHSSVVRNFVSMPTDLQVNDKQIAFVGRLSHEKAPDRFIQLAAKLPSVAFHIYGSGPMEQEIKQSAPPNVFLHGHQSDMTQVWSNIEMLVMPSRYEGLPMAALEAMSRKIPVLSSPVGEMPSLIQHDINGWIAKSDAELKDYVEYWCSLNKVDKEAIKSHAHATIEQHYSAEAVLPNFLSAYQFL